MKFTLFTQDQLEVYRARLELVTGEEATNDQLQSGFESRKAKKLEAIRSSGKRRENFTMKMIEMPRKISTYL